MLIEGKRAAARQSDPAARPGLVKLGTPRPGNKQFIEYYVNDSRIDTGYRDVPTPGDVATLPGGLGVFSVASVEPSVHPSSRQPPRVARVHLTPLPSPAGGQGGIAPSKGDSA